MYFIPALLFALSANIDSFIIGMSCGIRKTKISLPESILISLFTFCGTLAAFLTGSRIFSFFRFPYAEYAGKLILLTFGLYYVVKFLFMQHFKTSSQKPTSKEEVSANEAEAFPDRIFPDRQTLSWKASCIFGISLSANNLGIGLGASITGLSAVPTALISFWVSVLFLLLGNRAGHSLIFQKCGCYADFFCGLLLILLGIFI